MNKYTCSCVVQFDRSVSSNPIGGSSYEKRFAGERSFHPILIGYMLSMYVLTSYTNERRGRGEEGTSGFEWLWLLSTVGPNHPTILFFQDFITWYYVVIDNSKGHSFQPKPTHVDGNTILFYCKEANLLWCIFDLGVRQGKKKKRITRQNTTSTWAWSKRKYDSRQH